MTKLPRITQRIFGDTAIQDNAIAQFGSVVAQNPLFTSDIKQIQALDYWSKGWVGATVTARRYPTAEETTGINKVITQQLAYIFQEGIPEYDTGTTYPKGGWCKGLNADVATIYESLEDDNINNPLTDITKWKVVEFSGSGLEVCDIGMALYVDETKGLRRYLNGQIVDINANTQKFLARLKQITTLYPSLLCSEEEWQTAKTMSAFGQVGKFVFNYSGENIVSVRLPRVVNVQGLFDLQNLGMTVSAGLPNIKATFGATVYDDLTSGSVTIERISRDSGSATPNQPFYKNYFDASLSSPIYQNDIETVQPEAIQYPYFIQIATGSETKNNIINDIELNNPYSLFDSKYSDHELDNLSWLKSNGQYNAKAVYPTAYDKLLKVYNGTETIEGLSVKLWTDESATDYDFRINTADETFRLPLKNHTADDGNSVLTLYFYVGETVQNANLIDAGRIEEQLANHTAQVHITETYRNGTSWYRVYSDGWCEQGGMFSSNADSTGTISLIKEYSNTNYNCLLTLVADNTTMNNSGAGSVWIVSKTNSTFRWANDTWGGTMQWCACGYIA